MNMWRRISLSILMSALVASSAFAEWNQGMKLPQLKGAGLSGELPETAGKVVLVDFWASWCVPCKASFPVMSELYEKYKGDGFEIVAVSADDSRKRYDKFVERLKPKFPVLFSDTKEVLDSAQPKAMPTSYLVDRNGEIKFVHLGWHGNQSKLELEEQIEGLLKE